MCEVEEKYMFSLYFGGGCGYFIGDLLMGYFVLFCVFFNKFVFKDFGLCMYIFGGGFCVL